MTPPVPSSSALAAKLMKLLPDEALSSSGGYPDDNHGSLGPGSGLVKKWQTAELEKTELQKKLSQANTKIAELVGNLRECNDARITAETNLADKEKELADIRGHDIASSMKSGSTVQGKVEDEKGEGNS